MLLEIIFYRFVAPASRCPAAGYGRHNQECCLESNPVLKPNFIPSDCVPNARIRYSAARGSADRRRSTAPARRSAVASYRLRGYGDLPGIIKIGYRLRVTFITNAAFYRMPDDGHARPECQR